MKVIDCISASTVGNLDGSYATTSTTIQFKTLVTERAKFGNFHSVCICCVLGVMKKSHYKYGSVSISD